MSVALLSLMPVCRAARDVNPVAGFLKNAELQCEGTTQRDTIMEALNDILVLPEEELRKRRYRDYAGNKNRWDLPTLLTRHFVPDMKGKTLGDDFYRDVRSDATRREVIKIIKRMESR